MKENINHDKKKSKLTLDAILIWATLPFLVTSSLGTASDLNKQRKILEEIQQEQKEIRSSILKSSQEKQDRQSPSKPTDKISASK